MKGTEDGRELTLAPVVDSTLPDRDTGSILVGNVISPTPGAVLETESAISAATPAAVILQYLHDMTPTLASALASALPLEAVRKVFYEFLGGLDAQWNGSDSRLDRLNAVVAHGSIAVLRNILSTRNERAAGLSSLAHLMHIFRGRILAGKSEAFLSDFFHLLRGAMGRGVVREPQLQAGTAKLSNREISQGRSQQLDGKSHMMAEQMRRYRSGLEPSVSARRVQMKQTILDYFGGTEADWADYRWHLRHIIKDRVPLGALVSLSEQERSGLSLAEEASVPLAITPYYLSLFDPDGPTDNDRLVRAQVIPDPHDLGMFLQAKTLDADALDFMQERHISPAKLITRRYPQIAILKPINTCPQICRYCQRNWELEGSESLDRSPEGNVLENALRWFESHETIHEVLITGGDPFLLPDPVLSKLLSRFANMSHIERIRIGTRMLVNLPARITESLLDIISRWHEPGRREVVLVTHFEHVSEMTPEALDALSRVRRTGMSIYNQTVYTFHNSKRFENAALRKLLRLCGVDPYYTFNTKGKDETASFRVPIARILQEANEEARLLAGIARTDEPVFNIPRMGKNYLRAGQYHKVIGISEDGGRIVEFQPWDRNAVSSDTYVFKDVPIHDYLQRLQAIGEDISEYSSIWYYF